MNIQRLIIALIATCLLVSHRALAADTVTYDGIIYTILTEPSDGQSGTCEVGRNSSFSGHANIPPSISNESKTYDVIAIGDQAFAGCTGLTSVTIPASVTSIGNSAFSGYNGLTSVTIPASVTSIGANAFSDCTGLTKLWYNAENCDGYGFNLYSNLSYHWLDGCSKLSEVVIGENVKTIPEYFLYNCAGLTSMTIPASVTSIGYRAFYYCTGLTSVTIPASVTSIGERAFAGCTGLTKLIYNAENCDGYGFESAIHWLSGCSNLSEVVIGENVKTIPKYFLYDCTGLTSITIPASVTSIGARAFAGCTGLIKLIYNAENGAGVGSFFDSNYYWLSGCSKLSEVVIGENVKTLPDYFIENCTGLTSVTIPASVTSIGFEAFSNCTGLTSVTIPASVTSIGYKAFSGCTGLTSVTIPASVTSIGYKAFSGCAGLTKLIYNAENCAGEGFTSMPGDDSFYGHWLYGCSKLSEVVIGENVKTIPKYFLYNCTVLTSVSIPASVTSIGESAFVSCTGLTSITIPASVTSIGYRAFEGCTGLIKLIYNAENCVGYISEGTILTNSNYHWLDGCSKLSEVVIGENVKTLPDYFLDNCAGLTSITIPASVTSIGCSAFEGCTGLTKLIYNAENCAGAGFDSYFDYYSSYHWLSGCSKLSEVVIGENVKTIPEYFLYKCTGLTSITIPASVTSIGRYAFEGCSSLNVVNTPSLKAWTQIEFSDEKANPTYYAKKLLVNGETIRRMTLPDDLTQLNSYAFVNCEPLVTVNCGSDIINAGTEVFSGCTGLQRIYFPNQKDFLQINYESETSLLTYNNKAVIYIGESPYDYSNIEWPVELTEIPPYAFYNNTELKNFDIPESVTSIGHHAFAGCENLSDIVIPSKITQIADATFEKCSRLSAIEIPSSVTSIGSYAFAYCVSLRSITIPASVTSIGNRAFYCCSWLREVNIEDVNAWARIKFGGAEANPIYHARTFRKKGMEEPIRKLDLKGIKEISDYAFYNAKNLNTIRTDAEIIGSYAFSGCSNVTDLSISADSIGSEACGGMTNLKNIHSRTTIPPIAQDNTFSNYTGVNLYVPQGTVSAYENAENCWWRFLNTYEHNFSDSDAIFEADYPTGIENVKRNDTFNVWSANGCVYIEAPASDYVEIYSLHGAKIHGGYGSVVKATSLGVYIVRVNDSATKILVK